MTSREPYEEELVRIGHTCVWTRLASKQHILTREHLRRDFQQNSKAHNL